MSEYREGDRGCCQAAPDAGGGGNSVHVSRDQGDCGRSVESGSGSVTGTKRRRQSDVEQLLAPHEQAGGPPRQRGRKYPRIETDLVVQNIPSTTPVNRIVEHFAHFGEIKQVKTRFSTQSQFMKALVRYRDPSSKKRAITQHKNRPAAQSPASGTTRRPNPGTARRPSPSSVGASALREDGSNALGRHTLTNTTAEPSAQRTDCSQHGESKTNYRTPPMRDGTVSKQRSRLTRSNSFDQKHAVSKTMCELAGSA